MMDYLLLEYRGEVDMDAPTDVYCELDADRREVRRVEFYQSGPCVCYGAERGRGEALRREPYPEDYRTLSDEAEQVVAHRIPASLFYEIWNTAQERPDGFMELFF